MEAREEFQAGDRNNGNGTSLEQKEASSAVFEDGQIRDATSAVRPMKDGESYVYGDSRPDRTEASDTFVDVSESPMMTTSREGFPEARKEAPEFLESHRVDQKDHIEPHFRKGDPNQGEEAILVPGAREGGNEQS